MTRQQYWAISRSTHLAQIRCKQQGGMKEGLKGTGEGQALIWASPHHQGQQLERRRQPRRRALVGTAWESEGVSHWPLPFSRWRRMQSYCLKMGRGGEGGRMWGLRVRANMGSQTRELMRGPGGRAGGTEGLALSGSCWPRADAGSLYLTPSASVFVVFWPCRVAWGILVS